MYVVHSECMGPICNKVVEGTRKRYIMYLLRLVESF